MIRSTVHASRSTVWPLSVRRIFAALAALVLLPACQPIAPNSYLPIEVLQRTTEYVLQRLDRAWATPSGSLIALQRPIGNEVEQVIGLVNDTTLPGDNQLWLRARVPDGFSAGRFRLQEFLARVGTVPPPFTEVSDRDLRSATDSLGSYFYLVYRTGGEVNCVLAFRRIDGARRLLPPGTSVMEAMLRNCVPGPVELALVPITDAQIGVSAVAATAMPQGGDRMLSPLAAPQIE
jgi:hypothetical protein